MTDSLFDPNIKHREISAEESSLERDGLWNVNPNPWLKGGPKVSETSSLDEPIRSCYRSTYLAFFAGPFAVCIDCSIGDDKIMVLAYLHDSVEEDWKFPLLTTKREIMVVVNKWVAEHLKFWLKEVGDDSETVC